MQRFREWRESVKQRDRQQQQAEAAAAAAAAIAASSAAPSPSNARGALHSASASSPTSASTVAARSFAELDQLRRDRHAIFVKLLADPDSFASFLRFLPPGQQHELLFICEVNQLVEKAHQWDEAEIFAQAIKIANIFLRNADSSSHSVAAHATGHGEIDGSVLQVQSIQPATRRHLQACIPLSLPAHLLPAGAPAPATPAVPSHPLTDTKAILVMLESARDQVEESISKSSLPRFIDLLNFQPNGGLELSPMAATVDALVSEATMTWEYTFDDCSAAANDADPDADLGHVFRSFLLWLMEDKRHRILVFWQEVQRALASVQDPDLDPAAATTQGARQSHLTPSASTDELRSTRVPTSDQSSPLSAPVAAAHAATQPPHRTLSQLYALYTSLEDSYHRFYPDTPFQRPYFFMHDTTTSTGVEVDEGSALDTPLSPSAAHLLSPTSPYLASTSNPADPSLVQLTTDLDADVDVHASVEDVLELRANIRELIAKLRPMCAKMDKLLRYTFWPQFCKSELYHKLSKTKRPVPIKLRDVSRNSSRRNSADLGASSSVALPSAAPTIPAKARVKHALVSSLKQQKVTREMLVLECADWDEVSSRTSKRMTGQVATSRARTADAPREERDRLLEYVCVLQSSPVLPPRSTAAHRRRVSAAVNSGAPPLPPRPANKLRFSPGPGPASPSPDPSSSAPSGVLRGNQSLSLFYRYPVADHSSSQMPVHLMDLAFPNSADATHPDCACTCAQTPPHGLLQCVKDTTRSDGGGGVDAESSRPTSRSSSDATGSACESDFYGFPVTATAASQVSRPVGVSNRLFNLVCTQEDGSLLHGCVLQLTQVETVEERWEEVEPIEDDPLPPPPGGVVGVGIGADVHSRERRRSLDRGLAQDHSKSIVSGVGSSVHGRQPSLTMVAFSSPPTPSHTLLPTPSPTVSPPTPSSKLSQFLEDAKNLIERVTGDSAPAVAAEPTPVEATALPSPDATLALAVGQSPALAAVPSTSSLSQVATQSVAGISAASTVGWSSGSLPAPAGEFATPPRRSSSSAAAVPHSARTLGVPVVQRHHRVYRTQTQYAIVLLSRQPLFNLLRSALTNLMARATATAANSVGDADRQDLRSTFPLAQLRGALAEIFDSPAFLRLLTYTHLPAHSLDLFGLAPIVCTPSYLTAPPLDFHFDLLFRCLHPRRLLLALESLICERRVLLVSSSNSMLTLAGQALLSLLYPFAWRYLYVPILPLALFKYLACPTPFLMGVHSCYRRKARELAERDCVIVDLDHDEVVVPTTTTSGQATATSTSDASHLPHAVREQLLAHAARLFQPELNQLDTDGGLVDQRADDGDVDGPASAATTLPLTPEKPPIDLDARKFVDPYAAAEAPSAPSDPAGMIAPIETPSQDPATSDRPSVASTLPDAFSPSAPTIPSSSTLAAATTASTRSLLLQLEFVKAFSHLLKNFRQFTFHLTAPGEPAILIFDCPAFLAAKPEHYQPFLKMLLNTSYFPSFLFERSGPLGLEPVQRDAFDRYEASLSQTRIQVWQSAYAYQRQSRKVALGGSVSPPFTHARRASFARWLDLYRTNGVDPSLHHTKHLPMWNVGTNLTWAEIEQLSWHSAGWHTRPSANEVASASSLAPPSFLPAAAVPTLDASVEVPPLATPVKRKSSLYRTQRPSNASRSNSTSRTNSPVRSDPLPALLPPLFPAQPISAQQQQLPDGAMPADE